MNLKKFIFTFMPVFIGIGACAIKNETKLAEQAQAREVVTGEPAECLFPKRLPELHHNIGKTVERKARVGRRQVRKHKPAKIRTVSKGTSFQRYEFKNSRCTTGRHMFTGTESEAIEQMCEALQDNGLNCNCAEGSRQTYFEVYCDGMTFQAKNGPVDSTCGEGRTASAVTAPRQSVSAFQ